MITPDSLPAWFAIPADIILWGTLIYLVMRDVQVRRELRTKNHESLRDAVQGVESQVRCVHPNPNVVYMNVATSPDEDIRSAVMALQRLRRHRRG